MVNNEEQTELNILETEIDEEEQEEMRDSLQTSIEEVSNEWGVEVEQIKEALGPLAEIIPSLDSATVTDLYYQVYEELQQIRFEEMQTERQLDDKGLEDLRYQLEEFQASIMRDQNYLMDITRMIHAVKLRTSQVNIPGLEGFGQGGPSLDELQRITDNIRSNEPPPVRLSGSVIGNNDEDDVLQAALKKHFGK